jgi:hypothetical protein
MPSTRSPLGRIQLAVAAKAREHDNPGLLEVVHEVLHLAAMRALGDEASTADPSS